MLLLCFVVLFFLLAKTRRNHDTSMNATIFTFLTTVIVVAFTLRTCTGTAAIVVEVGSGHKGGHEWHGLGDLNSVHMQEQLQQEHNS